jgi:UPF0176 protein
MISNNSNGNDEQRVVVMALYKFVHLPDYISLKAHLLAHCEEQGLRGTLLLAKEGINGTVAGSRTGIDSLLNYLKLNEAFADISCKESFTSEMPFHRMKVRLKKEIVSMGIRDVDAGGLTGIRVEPKDWNALISDPEVLLIDTRNQYEYDIGTFKNAISPKTETFREFPAFTRKELDPDKHQRVAMFCTGGIRCEKASAYLLDQGFEEVYQLNGGILKYLEEMKPEQSLWQGECFVFDSRVAVNGNLERGIYQQCYACRRPLSAEARASDKYEQGVSCPQCYDKLSDAKRSSARERQRQVELAEQRNQQHIGVSLTREK